MEDQENKDKPSLFGAKSSGGVFGTGQAKSGGLFGAKTSGPSVFGDKPSNPAEASVFGGAKKDESKPAASIFSTGAGQPSTSIFGGGVKPTGGLFGKKTEEGKTETPASTGEGMFASKPAPTSGLFNKAGDKPAPTGGLFGSNANKQGESKSLFGSKPDENKPASAPASSLFAKKTEDGSKRYV